MNKKIRSKGWKFAIIVFLVSTMYPAMLFAENVNFKDKHLKHILSTYKSKGRLTEKQIAVDSDIALIDFKARPKMASELISKIAKYKAQRIKEQQDTKLQPDKAARILAVKKLRQIRLEERIAPKYIKVVFELSSPSKFTERKLLQYGVKIKNRHKNLVEADVPINIVEAVAKAVPEIKKARSPKKFFPFAVTSEGVNLTGANVFHSTGYKGKGVKVAVIDGGFKGSTDAKNSGELPANIITEDKSEKGIETVSFHGTACAEIIYDMAPAAQIYLVKFDTEGQFYQAVEYCISQKIDIISFSMGIIDGPGDGTGELCNVVNSAKANDILWVNAAGNYAEMTSADGYKLGFHWQGLFTDNNNDNTHEFSQSVEGYYNMVIGFPETDDDGNEVRDEITIVARWNDWPSANTDYDLYLIDSKTETVVASSTDMQNGSQQPVETIVYDIPQSEKDGVVYYVELRKKNGEPAGVEVELFTLGSCVFYPYYTNSSSITEPASAEGAFAVGAISKSKWATGPQEEYSSQGPTNAWAGSSARVKPDISGPDETANYTYTGGFSGTSASAPHVAGAAALLLSMYPNMTTDQLGAELQKQAVDLGLAGKDNIYGAGRLNLPDAKSYLADVVINEFVPNPDGSNSEWVELYNKGAQDINIGGCWLDDITSGGEKPQQIAEGTTIPKGGYYVHTLYTGDGYLNNSGDTVNFIVPDGTTLIDSKSFTTTKSDCSIYRLPDGGNWADNFDDTPTKGAANDGPQEYQPPEINPQVPNITMDEDPVAPYEYDLTQHETDPADTDSQLVWSIAGVNTDLFTASIDSSTDVLTITPVPNANGSDVVTLTLTNSHSLTDTQDITITINPVNDAPVMSSIPDQTIKKGESFAIIKLDDFVWDVDNPKSELIFTYSTASRLNVSIDQTTHEASVVPKDADWIGQETVTFTVQDPKGETASKPVKFTVNPLDNTAPTLQDASVSPSSADNTAEFTFSVKYVDTEEDIPTVKMVVIDGFQHDMALSSGDRWNGTYIFSARLWESSNHRYYFVFSDGQYEVRAPQEGEYQGPVVTVPADSAMLYAPKATPRISDINATYEFSVWYFDAAGKAPSVKNVVIDGTAYSLSLTSGSANNGVYGYSTTLSELDTHTYYFEFTNGDATKSLRQPSVGSYNEPIVTAVGGPSDLVVDDFEDAVRWQNAMGFYTDDDATCSVDEDVDGVHKLTWDGVNDYWYSCFADTGGFLQAKKYNVISLRIKSEQENPQIIFKLRNSLAVSEGVSLNDYSVIDNNYRTIDIPLSDFIYHGLDAADLFSVALVFKTDSGTIYIDDLKFKYNPALAPQETSYIPSVKPPAAGRIVVTGNKLFINGEPFFVKAIGYQPVPIGETPGSWDKQNSAIYERDFPLIKATGANTIKTWDDVSPMMMYHAQQYGLMVIAGFYIDGSLNLADTATRNSIKDSFRAYIQGYKDREGLLMWSLGGEQNLSNGDNSAWYSLANELAQIAYEEEGLNYHPVLIDNADIDNVGYLAKSADDNSLPYVDVWGITLYRGRSCGFAFADALSRTHKPILVSEYGIDAYDNVNQQEDQNAQSDWDKDIYTETVSGQDCIGSSVMAYSDEWWKWPYGSKWAHEKNGWNMLPGTFPDNFSNEEFYGIMSIEDDGENIDKVHTRPVYYTLQEKFPRTGRSFMQVSRPAAPLNVTASVSGSDVNLTWDVVSGDIAGYNVYRSEKSGNGFVRLNSAVVSAVSYLDRGLEQKTYYYLITAVTTGHIPLEGIPSDEKIVNVGTNTAPVASDLSVTTDEDTAFSITLNATDPEGDSLTYEIVAQPNSGGLSVISGNKVTYTPNSNYNGADSFTYKANDGHQDSNAATVTITVTPVNDAPTISGMPNQQGLEDVAWTLDVSTYISDIDTPKESLIIAEGSAYATVNGQVITFLYPNGITQEQVTITVSDGELSASQTIKVDVMPVNDPPAVSGIPDQTIQQEQSFRSFDLDDYVQDIDNPDEQLTWVYSGNNKISVNIDASTHIVTLTYPASPWTGEETITFTATDPDGLSASDTAIFKVKPINHAPAISGLPDKTLNEDTSLDNTIDLLQYASDIDADETLTFTITNNTAADSGVSIDSNRYIDISPTANWSGASDVTIRVTDSGGLYAEDTFTVTVNPVNDPPVIQGIPDQQGTEDISWTLDVSTYINDIDTPKESLIITEGSAYATVNGQVITFLYPNGVTQEQVTITVSDGELSASQTIGVTITPVDDEEKAIIIGKVKNKDGLGIEGVTLSLTNRHKLFSSISTDSQGNYRFDGVAPGCIYSFAAYPPAGTNYALTAIDKNIPVAGTYVDNDITLDEGGIAISGRVTDELAGQPISNLKIKYEQKDTNAQIDTQTSASGEYAFANLAKGQAVILALPERVYAGDSKIMDFQTDAVNVDFVLKDTAVIRGKAVKEDTGEPFTNAIVKTFNAAGFLGAESLTDAKGEFNMESLVTGICSLKLMPDSTTAYAWSLPAPCDNIYLQPRQAVTDLSINSKPGALVTARVVDSLGNPVYAIEYRVNEKDSEGWGLSDEQGRFQIRLPQGKNILNFVDYPTYGCLGRIIDVSDASQVIDLGDIIVYSNQDGAKISGEVLNGSSYNKIGDFYITAYQAGFSIGEDTIYGIKNAAAFKQLKIEGVYELGALSPSSNYDLYLSVYKLLDDGRYSITLRDKRLNIPAGSEDIDLNYNQEGGIISGKIIDLDENPVLGAISVLADKATGNYQGIATTDQNGDYIFYNVPEGEYAIKGLHSLYVTSTVVCVDVSDDKTTTAENIVISKSFFAPEIAPAIKDISTDEDVLVSYDLTQNETDPIDSDAQLVWSISGVNTDLFTADIDAASDVLTITPVSNANGSDVVTLTLTNSHGLTDTQDITVTINPVNDPPVFGQTPDEVIDEGEQLSFTVTAQDIDGDSLVYSAQNLPEGAVFRPIVDFNGNQVGGNFIWRPSYSQGRSEPYIVTFSVADGTVSISMDVRITVNDVPQPDLPPTAQIISITPSPVELGGAVTFAGAGIDENNSIVQYKWVSDIGGEIYNSTSAIFTTSVLSAGLHTISLTVKSSADIWSESVSASLEVVAEPIVITYPQAGAQLTGIVPVSATANLSTIENAYLLVDENSVAGDNTRPFVFDLNTANYGNGNHALKVKASYTYYETYKLFGLIPITVAKTRWVQSAAVNVVFDNPVPDLRIVSPQDGAVLSGTVSIDAIADGAAFVFYYIDNKWTAVDFSPFSYTWDTTRAANGEHTIYIKAFYLSGLRWITSSVVKVEVEN